MNKLSSYGESQLGNLNLNKNKFVSDNFIDQYKLNLPTISAQISEQMSDDVEWEEVELSGVSEMDVRKSIVIQRNEEIEDDIPSKVLVENQ